MALRLFNTMSSQIEEFRPLRWIWIARTEFLRATFLFTIISALHYVILVQKRLREHTHALPPARNPAS
jgi:hypothetical protein